MDFDLGGVEGRVRIHDAAQEGRCIHRRERQFAAGRAAIVEHVLDELVHAGGGGDDAVQAIRDDGFGGGGAFLLEDLAESAHGAQRSAQVVGNAVGKILKVADGFFEPGGAFGDTAFELEV